jgi:hypothetical protein
LQVWKGWAARSAHSRLFKFRSLTALRDSLVDSETNMFCDTARKPFIVAICRDGPTPHGFHSRLVWSCLVMFTGCQPRSFQSSPVFTLVTDCFEQTPSVPRAQFASHVTLLKFRHVTKSSAVTFMIVAPSVFVSICDIVCQPYLFFGFWPNCSAIQHSLHWFVPSWGFFVDPSKVTVTRLFWLQSCIRTGSFLWSLNRQISVASGPGSGGRFCCERQPVLGAHQACRDFPGLHSKL